MATNINPQNRTVMPVEAQPSLKAVTHSSTDQETEINKTASKEARAIQAEKAAEEKPAEKNLNQAVEDLNNYVQSINRNLEFNIDNDSGKTVVKVIDSETEELIRQIPNEEALRIAKNVGSQLIEGTDDQGLLLTKLQA